MIFPIEIRKHPNGLRFYILGCRIHHGLVGEGLVLAGGILFWTDRHDFPFLRD